MRARRAKGVVALVVAQLVFLAIGSNYAFASVYAPDSDYCEKLFISLGIAGVVSDPACDGWQRKPDEALVRERAEVVEAPVDCRDLAESGGVIAALGSCDANELPPTQELVEKTERRLAAEEREREAERAQAESIFDGDGSDLSGDGISLGQLPAQSNIRALLGRVVGYTKWFGYFAGIGGFMLVAIKFMVGRRYRSQQAADSVGALVWISGGLLLLGMAGSLAGVIEDSADRAMDKQQGEMSQEGG